MSLLEFLILLIAGICGGTWLARVVGLPEIFGVTVAGTPFPIVGSPLFVAIIGLISGRAYSRTAV